MSDDGFLSRWSDRKRRVAEEELEDVAAPVADAPEEELPEAEYLAEHALQDPDDMKAGDDFTAFLKTGVPAALKRRALRRLWTLNPVLANVDGLVEYGEDYTDAATVVANLQTGYEVGKGFLKRVLEEEDPPKADENELEADPPEEDTAVADADLGEAPADPEPVPEPQVAEFAAVEIETAPAPRRRMAFRFDET